HPCAFSINPDDTELAASRTTELLRNLAVWHDSGGSHESNTLCSAVERGVSACSARADCGRDQKRGKDTAARAHLRHELQSPASQSARSDKSRHGETAGAGLVLQHEQQYRRGIATNCL